ncbi:MAG: hypothetical protein R3E31_18445 [Chloroflexota bacterium]
MWIGVFDAVHGDARDEHRGSAARWHQAVKTIVRLRKIMDFFDFVLWCDEVTGVFVGADFGKLVEGKETAVWQRNAQRGQRDITGRQVEIKRNRRRSGPIGMGLQQSVRLIV